MGCVNLPVQVIVHYAANGAMQPLRFRFEDVRNGAQTIHVDQVADIRRLDGCEAEVLMFLCRADSHMYELKYTLHDHKWVLFRQIY